MARHGWRLGGCRRLEQGGEYGGYAPCNPPPIGWQALIAGPRGDCVALMRPADALAFPCGAWCGYRKHEKTGGRGWLPVFSVLGSGCGWVGCFLISTHLSAGGPIIDKKRRCVIIKLPAGKRVRRRVCYIKRLAHRYYPLAKSRQGGGGSGCGKNGSSRRSVFWQVSQYSCTCQP